LLLGCVAILLANVGHAAKLRLDRATGAAGPSR
jgi:hypothetical protein